MLALALPCAAFVRHFLRRWRQHTARNRTARRFTHHTMKLHADKRDTHSITAYGEGWIAVNGQRHSHSLVLASNGQLLPWECARFEDLTAAHFAALSSAIPEGPELVIFGSGTKLRFLRPALLGGLMAQRIGVETMDTAAACRTYNILASEGRRVVAALLIEA